MKAAHSPTHFKDFTVAQLNQFIAGCHRARDYTEQFNAACVERNSRPTVCFNSLLINEVIK